MYKLLIVDDNIVQVKSLMHYLDWEAYRVTEIRTAVNGRQGLEVYRDFEPDILLVDVSMPVMNGLEMVQSISRRAGFPKVIYMSCYDSFEYLQEALETGGTSYLLKPIDRDKLESVVRTAVREIETHADEGGESASHLPMLRESLLYYLLYSGGGNMSYLERMYRDTGLTGFRQYLILRLEALDGAGKEESGAALQKLRERMAAIPRSISVLDDHDRLVCLLMEESDDGESFLRYAGDVAAQWMGVARETYGAPLWGCVSSVGKSPYDIPLLIRQAADASDRALIPESGRLYAYGAERASGAAALKDRLEELVARPSEMEFQRFISAYCGAESGGMDAREIEIRRDAFLAAARLLLRERGVEDVKLDEAESSVSGARVDTPQRLSRYVRDMLEILSQYANKSASRRAAETVSQLTAYINENYADITSVDQLARHCYVSASYARWAFKQVNGKTIYEYLVMVRMDKAKQLLKSRVPVYSVARQIGYKSKANFVTAFRKYTGVLPGQFRDSQSKTL